MTNQVDTTIAGEPEFLTTQDEINYLRHKLRETQQEFQEFQESSHDLETEFETQIRQLEKKNSESALKLSRLENENEHLRNRYSTYTSDTQHKINEYQNQIGELTSVNDRLTSYIRELEQNNDDLERARRALAASLEDFEGQLNQQIERNVLLENEVSEKEELECVVQRLKEETRDLRHELVVRNNVPDATRRPQALDGYLSGSPASHRNSSLPSESFKSEMNESIVSELAVNDTTASTAELVSNDDNNSSTANSNFPPTNGSDRNKERMMVDSTTSPISNRIFSFSSTDTPEKQPRPQQTSAASPLLPTLAMSPSSRISALNIVSDLLKKVGALEARLASARKVTANQN